MRSSLARICLLILLFVLLLPGGCKRRSGYNTVLIGVDTLRRDYVGAFNRANARLTPAIDRLLSESVVFDRAFTVVPLTLPSVASAFTW